jgi:SAM-dependent methyltransferase
VRGVERYVLRGGRHGFERLQVLARSWFPTTSDFFDRIGLSAGQRCLDLACGGGDVSFEMAARVGPTGHVVGVDMDEVKLELARDRTAELGLANVEFRVSNVYDLVDLQAYDLVYCRNLLTHVARPVDVLRAMWDAVRPAGVIAVEDADFGGCFSYPPNDGFAFWLDRYQRVVERNGGDPLSGRKLLSRFAEAGIPEPELRVVQRVDAHGEAKTVPYSTLDATADAMISAGLATAEEIATALESLARFAADPSSVRGSPSMFQAWSRRPLTA